MPFIVKICGIRSRESLQAAVEAGAGALGFMAYPKSKRYIPPEELAALLREVEADGVRKVGVFVDPSFEELERYLAAGIDAIQLHGSESAAFAKEAATLAEVWKAFSPRSEAEIDAMRDYPAALALVDAYSPVEKGGSGLKADWTLARYAVEKLPRGAMLAGGLTPENVAAAIAAVKPAGADVSSGVETAPGVKDVKLIKAFVKAALEAASKELASKAPGRA